MAGTGVGAVWATCLVLFGGAMLTGLPPVLWWGPPPAAGRGAAGLAALLQGPSLKMLSAGLMLGSGLGVVVPEGFLTFVENAPPEHGGLPEWSAGAAMLAGFVGMLALQLWLEARSAAAAAAAAAAGGPAAEAIAADCLQADDDGGRARGDSPSGVGWRQRREGGYSALPSTAVADVEAGCSAAPSAAALVAGSGGMELSRRHGGGGTAAVSTAAVGTAPSFSRGGEPCSDSDAKPLLSECAPDSGKGALPSPPPYSRASSRAAAAASAGCSGDPSTAVGAVPDAAAAAPAGGADAVAEVRGAPAALSRRPGAAAVSSPPSLSSAQFALGGLLVHSAADGMAVGAASLGGGGGGGGPSALTLAVVAAILMHKLPVTLGLTTYLKEAGWQRGGVLQALLAFSASAPLSALASFYILGLLLPAVATSSGGPASGGGGGQGVALAVLFSGGTFLAAATQHILPAALAATLAAAAAPPPGPGFAVAAAPVDGCGAHGSGKGSAAVGSAGAAGVGIPPRVPRPGRLLPLMWLGVGAAAPLLIAALLPE